MADFLAWEEWSSAELHQVKRSLSRLEKSSLYQTDTPALILPGCPGTEIEELTQVGFSPRNIQAVEREQHLADELYEYYWDTVSVHWDEVHRFLLRSKLLYGYVHLDFCGHLHNKELEAIQATQNRLAPWARIRVSTLQNRRLTDQLEWEEMLLAQSIGNLLKALRGHYAFTERAEALEEIFCLGKPSEADTTLILVATILLNHFFGVSLFEYTDQCINDGAFLPVVRGTHQITSVQRFLYRERTGKHSMFTTWIDLVPMPVTGMRQDEEWVQGAVMQVLAALRGPVPEYTHLAATHDVGDNA